MSSLVISHYFPFDRIKVTNQNVSKKGDLSIIDIEPDYRFHARCHICQSTALRVHSSDVRQVRDLNLASAKVFLRCRYRTVYCPHCKRIVVEDLDLFSPYQRVTKRFASYIHALCQQMTIKDVAAHFELDWKTVKKIDRLFLEEAYNTTDYSQLRILAVDEIALKKGHRYMTVVIDYQTGRVVWMGEGRSSDTLKSFFEGMTEEQKKSLKRSPWICGIPSSKP